jgi:hypothetical protein
MSVPDRRHVEDCDADERNQIALNLARNNLWPVFPCNADKLPCISKCEGGSGFLDATLDPERIRDMLGHPRAALIAIATGERSGVDVLDVDVKHAAARAWLERAKDRMPPTRTYQSRSGGFHLYFEHAPGMRNSQSRLAQGIDVRGDGGQIIFWFGSGFPCTGHSPIAPWPQWLLDALLPKPQTVTPPPHAFRAKTGNADALIRAIIRNVESASDGCRHGTLRAAARTLGGIMVEVGLSQDQATRMLLDAVLVAGGIRVDQRNALATIRWGLEQGARAPLAVGRSP